jgi:hypothetical protein
MRDDDEAFDPECGCMMDDCPVCGRKLHTEEEDRIGMCEVCGNL